MSRRNLSKVFTNPEGTKVAKVYRDSEWNEYRTTFLINGVKQEGADSHTGDRQDAYHTAQSWCLQPLEAPAPVVKPAEETKQEPATDSRTIDVTPSWGSLLGYYVAVLEDGNDAGRKVAREELRRMAQAADKWNEHCKAPKAEPLPALALAAKALQRALATGGTVSDHNIYTLALDAVRAARGTD